MRLATFNVENMFRRPRALNPATRQANKPILEAFAALQELLERPEYTTRAKTAMLKHLATLGLTRSDESDWVVLRRSRGKLLNRRADGTVEVTAEGRGDWIGWLELKREAVNEVATRNTARVIAEVGADVLGLIEAEDRPALDRFNRDVLPFGSGDGGAPDDRAASYRHVMLIDGNDDRGIDVGLLTRDDHPIIRMRSHVDDVRPDGRLVFSRDCPEYEVGLPAGGSMLVFVNHFKSKGYGGQAGNDARRREQAERVAEIYEARLAEGMGRIAVLGDFNDTPESRPLEPLLGDTDLRDVSEHPAFAADGRAGTYGTSGDKIDYVLLSPALFDRVEGAGVNRHGVWHGPRVRNPWPLLDTLTRPEEAASDHAAVWADVTV